MALTPVQRKSLYRVAAIAIVGVVAVFVPGVSDAAGGLLDLVISLLP